MVLYSYDFQKDIVDGMNKTNPTTKELLKYIDVVVDGKFDAKSEKSKA